MNKTRRKALKDVTGQIMSAREGLQVVLEEEEEYRDNMPENLQASQRYEEADTCVETLQSAVDSLDEIVESISEIVEG